MNSIAIFWCGMVVAFVLMITGMFIYANIIYPAWRDRRGSQLDYRKLMKEMKKK